MATTAKLDVTVQTSGVLVSISNDKRARLMYYLNCICKLLAVDDNVVLKVYSDYPRYYLMESLAAKKGLVALLLVLFPENLDDKCIFLDEELDTVNKFIDVTCVQSARFKISNNIVLAGKATRVKKLMLYKMDWMHKYFIEPFIELLNEINRLDQAAIQ